MRYQFFLYFFLLKIVDVNFHNHANYCSSKGHLLDIYTVLPFRRQESSCTMLKTMKIITYNTKKPFDVPWISFDLFILPESIKT
jgi:hypothetical protein